MIEINYIESAFRFSILLDYRNANYVAKQIMKQYWVILTPAEVLGGSSSRRSSVNLVKYVKKYTQECVKVYF